MIELDNQIVESTYQLYKYTYLLRSTDLGRGKIRPMVDTIFDETRVILAECSVYTLSISDSDTRDKSFLHYQHFVRQCVNVINVSIYMISHNQEQYPFDDSQLQYITLLEKHFLELAQHMDHWAETNFGRTIFRLSSDLTLSQMADEALAEHQAGKTLPLDVDEL
jgi:hypothetical protein